MQSVLNHIERIKEKPHHHRKQIAYLYAGIGTAMIALVWLGASLFTGAFLIRDSSLTRSSENASITVDASQSLAGAAAALPQGAAAPAGIQIIDAATSSASAKQPERTVLPF